MAETLKLKTNHKPSFFNKDTLLGAAIGGMLPVPGGVPAAIAVMTATTLIGGYLGKQRQEKENAEGKQVNEGSLWNKDMVIGAAVGMFMSVIVGAITGVSAAALTAVTGAGLPAAGAVGLIAYAAGSVGTIIGGAYLGGKRGERTQNAEYAEAKQQNIMQNLTQNVSPEVAQAVEYTMAHNKNWAQDVLAEKLKNAGQQAAPGR